MIIRSINPSDLPKLQKLFKERGFDYELPSLKFFVSTVAIEAENDIKVGIAARPTVELYMLNDLNYETPGIRFELLKTAVDRMRKQLYDLRYIDAHAWLPPQVAKSFGRRLVKDFEFFPSPWACFTSFTGR